jgi:sulfur carrier protein ThiS
MPKTQELVTPVVRIAQLGNDVIEVAYEEGMTVRQALEAADVNTEGFQVKVANQPVDLDTPVQPDDAVVLVGRVRGGAH